MIMKKIYKCFFSILILFFLFLAITWGMTYAPKNIATNYNSYITSTTYIYFNSKINLKHHKNVNEFPLPFQFPVVSFINQEIANRSLLCFLKRNQKLSGIQYKKDNYVFTYSPLHLNIRYNRCVSIKIKTPNQYIISSHLYVRSPTS